MRKRLVNKLNRLLTWGVITGSLLSPHIANAKNYFQNIKPKQEISDSRFIPVGKTAKPVLEERLKIVNPIEDFSMKTKSTWEQDIKDVYSYNGSSKILTEIEELDPEDLIETEINDKGKLVVTSKDKTGRAGIVTRFYENSVGVAPASFGRIKSMFKDGKRKPLAKPSFESVYESVSDTFYVDVTKAMSDLKCFVWNLLSEDYSDRLVQGAIVEVNGVKDTTDENGKIELQFEPGFYRMKIEHPDFEHATRHVNLEGDLEFDTSIIHNDFDMEFYKRWCESFGCTQRWETQPRWYIDINPAKGYGNEITPERWGITKDFLENILPGLTGEFFNKPYIEVGTNFPKGIGWVTSKWKDNGVIGYHTEFLEGNKIVAGAVGFWTLYDTENPEHVTKIYNTLAEECMQVHGLRGEVLSSEMIRLWNEEKREYTQEAKDIFKVLYSRPIGTIGDVWPESF